MLNRIFGKKNISSGSVQYLVVGLGNPGGKYELTRHNVGFMFVDRLCTRAGGSVKKLKYKSLYGDIEISGVRCLVMKPQTFMNLSGKAVKEAAAFYKIPPENIIVVFDDISLDAGCLRIRKKGSDGGHNGIKSIIAELSSDNFPRIKIGIGPKPIAQMDLADFVLSKINAADEIKLASAIDNAVDALSLMLHGKYDEAMNKYN